MWCGTDVNDATTTACASWSRDIVSKKCSAKFFRFKITQTPVDGPSVVWKAMPARTANLHKAVDPNQIVVYQVDGLHAIKLSGDVKPNVLAEGAGAQNGTAIGGLAASIKPDELTNKPDVQNSAAKSIDLTSTKPIESIVGTDSTQNASASNAQNATPNPPDTTPTPLDTTNNAAGIAQPTTNGSCSNDQTIYLDIMVVWTAAVEQTIGGHEQAAAKAASAFA